MSQIPAHRQRNHLQRRLPPHIPTLGSSCLDIRTELRLSRARAYQRHGISPSYLADIEADRTTPSLLLLDKLIAGYELDPMRTRHLRELHAPGQTLPATERLRRYVREDRDLMTFLDQLDDRGIIAAYTDPLANLLASTERFRSWLAGIGENDNIRAWVFTPDARAILTDWLHEATHSVAIVKAMSGIYRDSGQARNLLRQLRPSKDFQRLWRSSTQVVYGRHVHDLLHRRDPVTQELESYRIGLADLTQNQHILLITAIPQPYSGPDPTDH
ncbi:helix-turn-helix domain-containing protein [Nocardia goodfellowii]